jgi:hypothetical protein
MKTLGGGTCVGSVKSIFHPPKKKIVMQKKIAKNSLSYWRKEPLRSRSVQSYHSNCRTVERWYGGDRVTEN